jgi:phage/conjugal plasmid C-4 type zinc finger TraR family protein
MAGGWTRDGAVQEQIDDSVADAVTSARARLPSGPGEIYCTECGEEIPEARRKALPGVTTCVACQEMLDRRAVAGSGINRRGNKDSQLK